MDIIFAINSFFGTVIFKKLLEKKPAPSLLITLPLKAKKKEKTSSNLLIRELAIKEKVEIKEAEDKETFHRIVKERNPEIVVLAAFGMIIPGKTLALSTFINVHPSLLPEYRGATPIQSAIIDNVEKSGVSIIKMNSEIDKGPVIAQREVPLAPRVTYKEAETLLAEEGGKLLLEVISFAEEEELIGNEQREEEATYTKVLTKRDGKIDWKEPAELIERKVRALNPWPGTYSKMGKKFFKVLEAEVQEQTSVGPFGDPGKVYLGTNHSLAIQTGKHFLLIKKLQIEGKNATTTKDFLQGNMQTIGIILS